MINQRTLVSTFAGRTKPTHNQNLQKNFQVPARKKMKGTIKITEEKEAPLPNI